MTSVQHVRVKIFAEEPSAIKLPEAIPVFHRWIQNKVRDELLIDVADYSHVPAGPGVVLIGHEANYSLDCTGNRLGLLYARKSVMAGTTGENLAQAFHAALDACRRLEQEPELGGKLKFNHGDCEISFNDRLLTPNTEETYVALKPEIEEFFAGVWGPDACDIEHVGEPRELLRVRVKARVPVK